MFPPQSSRLARLPGLWFRFQWVERVKRQRDNVWFERQKHEFLRSECFSVFRSTDSDCPNRTLGDCSGDHTSTAIVNLRIEGHEE